MESEKPLEDPLVRAIKNLKRSLSLRILKNCKPSNVLSIMENTYKSKLTELTNNSKGSFTKMKRKLRSESISKNGNQIIGSFCNYQPNTISKTNLVSKLTSKRPSEMNIITHFGHKRSHQNMNSQNSRNLIQNFQKSSETNSKITMGKIIIKRNYANIDPDNKGNCLPGSFSRNSISNSNLQMLTLEKRKKHHNNEVNEKTKEPIDIKGKIKVNRNLYERQKSFSLINKKSLKNILSMIHFLDKENKDHSKMKNININIEKIENLKLNIPLYKVMRKKSLDIQKRKNSNKREDKENFESNKKFKLNCISLNRKI